jgi:hypothetical protein
LDLGLDLELDLGLDLGMDLGLDLELGLRLDLGLGLRLDLGLDLGLGLPLDIGEWQVPRGSKHTRRAGAAVAGQLRPCQWWDRIDSWDEAEGIPRCWRELGGLFS